MAVRNFIKFRMSTASFIAIQPELHCRRCSSSTSTSESRLQLSVKPAAAEKIFQCMMSGDSAKDTILVIQNPGSKDFIKTFIHPTVKDVVCVYQRKGTKMAMEKEFKDEASKPTFRFPSIYNPDVLRGIKLEDVNLKILLKERDVHSNYLWHFQKNKFISMEGEHKAASLEWYCIIHPLHFQNLENRTVSGLYVLPPYYIYMPVLSLKNTDFEPPFRVKRKKNMSGTRFKGDEVLMVRAEPNYKILKYLPTVEDREKFAKFCELKGSISIKNRITPTLHELFPGCVTELSNQGFHVNTQNKDITMQDYLHIYLILTKLPGFEGSALNVKLSEK